MNPLDPSPRGGRAAFTGLLVLSGLTLGGCVTAPTYGPAVGEHRRGWGYSETANADGGYTIRVALPASLPPQTAFAWWERRAGELCGGPPSRKSIYAADRAIIFVNTTSAQAVRGDYSLEGYAWCAVPTAPAQAAAPAAP